MDDTEEADKEKFLEDLVRSGFLPEVAEGITKLVIAKGTAALSAKQQHVFQKEVIDQYYERECKRCQAGIPWSELIYSLDNGGLCSWCQQMESKDD